MIEKIINEILEKYNIDINIYQYYCEEHRFYHNINHIFKMINDAIELNVLSDELLLAIIFHDIIYNSQNNDNEEKSADLLFKQYPNSEIKTAILETKTHKPTTILSSQLCMLDLRILSSNFDVLIDYENKIFKEYQWVDYKEYVDKRIEFLRGYGVCNQLIDYVKTRKPKIGIYAGSFNPFHKGHYNILQKAEEIFDKVIIAKGINPQKQSLVDYDLPQKIQNRQIINYSGLLTDLIDNLKYDVTVIRGLRNATDLQYELTQFKFLQELKPDIKIVSLFCDKEYEHISSSSIKYLEIYNKTRNYLI